jgi:hypothetical protein
MHLDIVIGRENKGVPENLEYGILLTEERYWHYTVIAGCSVKQAVHL